VGFGRRLRWRSIVVYPVSGRGFGSSSGYGGRGCSKRRTQAPPQEGGFRRRLTKCVLVKGT